MPFTSRQMELLRQLEFSEEHIVNQLVQLSDDELSTEIKQQKRRLVVKYHPDKNDGNDQVTAKFLAIMAAADELLNPKELNIGLLETVKPFAYHLPVDCIDHRIQEQIDDYFETMSNYFNSLSSKQEQQHFIDEHKTFLQFVLWLEQNSAKIRAVRGEAFYRTVHVPSLFTSLKQNWHKLIIQFFAEENLNDIVYREAIALGKLDSILATRKLVSPIKWLCFIVYSTYDAITRALEHGLQEIIKDMCMDLDALSSDRYRIVPFLTKMVGVISAFALPLLLFPQLVLNMFALPLVVRGLFYLANPINQIIRPFSEYFNIAPIWVGLITASLGVVAFGAILLLSSSMIEILVAITSMVNVLSVIASALLLKKLYEAAPEIALILGAVVVSLALIQVILIDTHPVVETITSASIRLLSELSGLGLNVLGYQQLSNIKENCSELYVSLPWPEQEAPEIVARVVDEACQKNYWSHSLFNSPLQRNVAPGQQKMSWHSMGLFGKGAKQPEHSETLTWVPAV